MGGAPFVRPAFFVPLPFVCVMSGFCLFHSRGFSMLAFYAIQPAVPAF